MSMQAAIQKATDQLLNKNPDVEDGLVYVGNWHGTYPTTLVIDPSLTAVDVRVFLFICQYSQDLSLGATAFPSYEVICNRLRISKPTLSNSMVRLRLTRWLALVRSSIRDEAGRFKGQVITLSDTPMGLADVLEIDADYMQLVENTALNHKDKKTSYVAQGVLLGIEELIAKGIDPLARRNPMVERAESVAGLDQEGSSFFGVVDVAGRERLERQKQKTLLGKVELAKLSTEKDPKQPSKETLLGKNPGKNSLLGQETPGKESLLGGQVIDFIEEKNSLLGDSSTSTCISNSTSTGNFNFSNQPQNPTTSHQEAQPQALNLEWYSKILVLSEDEKIQLAQLLAKQDAENQQIILDALAYRYESIELRGSVPLKAGPLPYAKSLVAMLNKGQLKPVKPTGYQQPKTEQATSLSHKFYQPDPNLKPKNALNFEQTKARIARLRQEIGIRIG